MPKRTEPPWFQIVMLIVTVVLTLITIFLAPKPNLENERPKGLGDFDFPTATEGRVLPVLWGSAEVKGGNTIWYGAVRSWPIVEHVPDGLFSEKALIIGFIYYIGFDLGICLGPVDFLSRIEVGDKPMLVDAQIGLDQFPEGESFRAGDGAAWGGFKKGGGWGGDMTFYSGIPAQDVDPWMLSRVNQNVSWGVGAPPGTNKTLPSYPNLCHLVYKGGMVGETTQIRQISVVVHRYPNPLGLTGDRHIIDPDGLNRADANPMNALYEILTDTDYGRSIDPAEIEISEFIAAANTLYDEGNGFSMLLDQQRSARSVIREIERQTDGILYQTSDGRHHFRLARADYNPATLPVFDETNVSSVKSFTRSSWRETQNSVLVNFADRTDNYKQTGATAQDIANIQIQQRENRAIMEFTGVRSPSNAAAIAARELKQLSFPLARVTLICNREASALTPGSLIRWSWSRYGIEDLIIRVADIGLGTLSNGQMKVIGYQDIYGLGDVIYAEPQPGVDPGVTFDAVPVTVERSFDVPYWFLLSDQTIDESTVGDRSYHLADAPDGNSTQFDLYASINGQFEFITAASSTTPTGELTADYAQSTGALGAEDAIGFTIDNSNWSPNNPPTDITTSGITAFGYGLILVNNEIMAYEGFTDNLDGTYTLTNIHRAMLDTVAQAHSATDKVWFMRLGNAVSNFDLPAAPSSSTFRYVTRTINDVLDVASAPNVLLTNTERKDRPIRPGFVQINSSAYPTDEASLDLTTTWRRRDRQQPTVIDDDQADATSGDIPDFAVLEFRRRLSGGGLTAPFRTEAVADPTLTYTYTRAQYLNDAGEFLAGDRMNIQVGSRYTSPALDSHQFWEKEFDVDPGSGTSTLSLSLNASAPATEQQYILGPSFSSVWTFAESMDEISWSIWYKCPDTPALNDMVIGGTSNYLTFNDGFGMVAESATDWTIWFGDRTSGGGGATFRGANNVFDGNWHHIACTWDITTNQTPLVWVDGSSVTAISSSSRSTSVVKGSGRFDIGRCGTFSMIPNGYMEHLFDETGLWKGILTGTDVTAIYNSGSPTSLNLVGPTGTLYCWYRYGEGVGDDPTATPPGSTGKINDEGGNGNDADGTPRAVSGNATFSADVP